MKLKLQPTTLRKANEFVESFHRHSKPCRGARFCLQALYNEEVVGIAIIGRPVARKLDDGLTAEVNRVCVLPTAPKNTCSFLYGRAWRVWQQMGGERMITYTLQDESGSSLRGAGWKILGETKPSNTRKGWLTRENREKQFVYEKAKYRWHAQ